MVAPPTYWQNNDQRQFEHSKFYANLYKSSSKLIHRILGYRTQIVLEIINVCLIGDAIYIIVEIIVKDNLNIKNLMQTSEGLFCIRKKQLSDPACPQAAPPPRLRSRR